MKEALRGILIGCEAIVRGILIGCGAIVALLMMGFLGLLVMSWLLTPNPFDDRQFDHKLWLSSSNLDDRNNPRGQMFDDLRKRHLSKQLTKADVISLLGTPDNGQDAGRLSYNLGMWSGLRMDYDSLEVDFDSKGFLKRSFRVQH